MFRRNQAVEKSLFGRPGYAVEEKQDEVKNRKSQDASLQNQDRKETSHEKPADKKDQPVVFPEKFHDPGGGKVPRCSGDKVPRRQNSENPLPLARGKHVIHPGLPQLFQPGNTQTPPQARHQKKGQRTVVKGQTGGFL